MMQNARQESSGNKAFFALSIALCTFMTAVYLFTKQSYFSSYTSPFDIKSNARIYHSIKHEEGSEFRVDDNAKFHGAQEWHDHWSYLPRYKGGKVDDEHVLFAVESATNTTLQHFNDMKQRYQNVSALPDFYALGNGWVQDVSSLASFFCVYPHLSVELLLQTISINYVHRCLE